MDNYKFLNSATVKVDENSKFERPGLSFGYLIEISGNQFVATCDGYVCNMVSAEDPAIQSRLNTYGVVQFNDSAKWDDGYVSFRKTLQNMIMEQMVNVVRKNPVTISADVDVLNKAIAAIRAASDGYDTERELTTWMIARGNDYFLAAGELLIQFYASSEKRPTTNLGIAVDLNFVTRCIEDLSFQEVVWITFDADDTTKPIVLSLPAFRRSLISPLNSLHAQVPALKYIGGLDNVKSLKFTAKPQAQRS